MEYWEDFTINHEIQDRLEEDLFDKKEPFIVIYRSKPIKGIRLELIGKNPKYKEESEIVKKNLEKLAKACWQAFELK